MAGGVAVVAGAAVLGSTVLRSELAGPPIAPAPHYNVTVSPPAQGARPGVIATGSINGWRWQATLLGTGSNVMGDFGPSFGYFQIGTQVPLGGEFASFDSEGRGTGPAERIAYLGPATAAVRYLTVSLQNGQTLTLYPQRWSGHRYVAMILPAELQVEEAVAYGAHGELGYAIPFDYAGAASFGAWLRPGQTGRVEATARIASGGSGSGRWTAIGLRGSVGFVYAGRRLRRRVLPGNPARVGDGPRRAGNMAAAPADLRSARPGMTWLTCSSRGRMAP